MARASSSQTTPVSAIRKRIDGAYQEAIEALDKLAPFLNGTQGFSSLFGVEPHGVSAATGSNVDRVVAALTGAKKSMSVTDIAKTAGMSEAAIRTVLYTKKDRFQRTKLSPRKAVWKLKPQAAEVQEKDG